MPSNNTIPPAKETEELDYLFLILEETQEQILTRLEGLELRHCLNDKKWQKRLALMGVASLVKQDP